MTKQRDYVLEFLQSFIAGSSSQDFKPWARELYTKLYSSADEPPEAPFDRDRFEKAPCYLCGYNGQGYYNQHLHPCAAKYHTENAVRFLEKHLPPENRDET